LKTVFVFPRYSSTTFSRLSPIFRLPQFLPVRFTVITQIKKRRLARNSRTYYIVIYSRGGIRCITNGKISVESVFWHLHCVVSVAGHILEFEIENDSLGYKLHPFHILSRRYVNRAVYRLLSVMALQPTWTELSKECRYIGFTMMCAFDFIIIVCICGFRQAFEIASISDFKNNFFWYPANFGLLIGLLRRGAGRVKRNSKIYIY